MSELLSTILGYLIGTKSGILFHTGKLLIIIFTLNRYDPDFEDKGVILFTRVLGFLFYFAILVALKMIE